MTGVNGKPDGGPGLPVHGPPARRRSAHRDEADRRPVRFDFVPRGAVLGHLPDPSAALGRAMGWVREDGLLYLEVPSSDWLVGRLFNAYYRLRGRDYVSNLSPMHPPFHLYEFAPATFTHHRRIRGYRGERLHRFICSTFMPRPLDPLLRAIMAATGTGMQLSLWLRRAPAATRGGAS